MLSAGDISRRLLPTTTTTPSHHPRQHHSASHNVISSLPSSASLEEPRHKRSPKKPMEQHIWIVTGPAGCGKTTVAQELAKELSLPYIEGDDYHSASNKFKMSSGEPLTDADRWDWLTQLREAATDTLSSPSVSSDDPTPPSGVVVTCSALKSKYRDVIRVASSTPSPPEAHNTYHQQQAQVHGSVHVHFVYLRADEQTLLDRVAQRQGHYMKSDMVKSQLAMLEEPNATTEPDMLSIDCAAEPDVVQGHVNAAVREKLMEYRG